MRKIKGFRLTLRLREIQRRARKQGLDLSSSDLGEPELQELLAKAQRAIRPAVLFETFPHPDPDLPLLSPIPGLAYSLVLATLGEGLGPVTGRFAQENPSLAPLGPIIEEAALDEAARFATALIEEEAARESCELSPITPLSEPAALSALLRKLAGSKIGVSLSEARLAPASSRALCLSWIAKSKAKGKAKS